MSSGILREPWPALLNIWNHLKHEILTGLGRSRAEAEHLLRIATALADAACVSKMSEVVAQECMKALGADAICVHLLKPDGYFELANETNCTEEIKTRWRRFPKDMIPLTDLSHPQNWVFHGSAEELKNKFPEVAETVERTGRQTFAYALLVVNNQVTGLLGYSYKRKKVRPVGHTFLLTLINLCAQSLERARLTEEEQSARAAAEAANRAKTDFLANISHEIRTPLGVVQGFADLLYEEPDLDPKYRYWISIIRRNTRQLNSLIGDVLDITKIEADKLEIESLCFPLQEWLHDTITTAEFKAREKGTEIEFKVGDVPKMIKSDPTRLRQILLNLIGNAIKFTPEGKVRVDIESSGPHLQFTITDTGIGIAPEFQEHVFDPFMQADSSTQRMFGGTGLGLPISKRLAIALGGELKLVESAPGRGSTFSFYIPIEPPISSEEKKVTLRRATQPRSQRLSGIKVLLVEDSPDNQYLLNQMLSMEGAQVDIAASGPEGIKRALSGTYHVVLMDIQMPGMDGFQAVRELRDHGYKRPIAALTAHAIRTEMDKPELAGFDDYLTKPIDRPTLINTVARLSRI